MENDTLATRLKHLRQQAGLTQEELAERTKRYKPNGLHRTMIGKIESGMRTNVSLETLQVLALSLGCLIDDLVPSPDPTVDLREGSEGHNLAHSVLRQRIAAKVENLADIEDLQRVVDYIDFIHSR